VLSQRYNNVALRDDTDNLVIFKHDKGGYTAIVHHIGSRFQIGVRAYGDHLVVLAVYDAADLHQTLLR
jgi:hypothetical protein